MPLSLKQLKIGPRTLVIVGLLIGLKFLIKEQNLEFFSLNALFTSAIAGAIFIMGFLLAGIMTDYKEAEKISAEIRSSLEIIH